MMFITESGSQYQLDIANKNIRRLSNTQGIQATARIGNNEWRQYAELFPDPVEVGKPLLIVWGDGVNLLPDTVVGLGQSALKTTLTSTVVEILPGDIQ